MKLLRVVWAVLGLWAALLSLAHDALPHSHSSDSANAPHHFHPWGEADPCESDHGHEDWKWLCDWLDHHASDIPNDDHHVGIWKWSGSLCGGDGAVEDGDILWGQVACMAEQEWPYVEGSANEVRFLNAEALKKPGYFAALALRGPPVG
jgi:hypothetical protein